MYSKELIEKINGIFHFPEDFDVTKEMTNCFISTKEILERIKFDRSCSLINGDQDIHLYDNSIAKIEEVCNKIKEESEEVRSLIIDETEFNGIKEMNDFVQSLDLNSQFTFDLKAGENYEGSEESEKEFKCSKIGVLASLAHFVEITLREGNATADLFFTYQIIKSQLAELIRLPEEDKEEVSAEVVED